MNSAPDDELTRYVYERVEAAHRELEEGKVGLYMADLARYRAMSMQQLVAAYVAITVEQQDALNVFETATYNRLYDHVLAIENELADRPGDQRRALLPLLEHGKENVRLKAAVATLPVAPRAAREVIEALAARPGTSDQQAFEARERLESLDAGRYVPDQPRRKPWLLPGEPPARS
jgi:hypothetical protein